MKGGGFNIRGEEEVLIEPDGEWDRVVMQTNWKLENCMRLDQPAKKSCPPNRHHPTFSSWFHDCNTPAADGTNQSITPDLSIPNEPSTSTTTSSPHHQGLSVTVTEPDNESGLCQEKPQPASNEDPSDEGTSTSFLDNGQDTALNIWTLHLL